MKTQPDHETLRSWADQVEELSTGIWASAFAGREPAIQGAVLAGLMAIYLRGYKAEGHDDFLAQHNAMVRMIVASGWDGFED